VVRRDDARRSLVRAQRAAPLSTRRSTGQGAGTAPGARILRARSLAITLPASAEPLTFYANLVELQQRVLDEHPRAVRPSSGFAESLDPEAAADAVPALLTGLLPIAPPPVVAAATAMLRAGHAEWRHAVHTCWGGTRDGDTVRSFLAEALLQPFAEAVAAGVIAPARGGDGDLARACPACGDRPVVAVLRDAAHGARRSLVCGFCLTEWPAPRIACMACGERQFEKLAIYRAEEMSAVRVDACETCRSYIKGIDLTRDATAVPVVDDLATVPLDLWARREGYERIRPNLLRL
jgi:FdhE protein